MEGFEIIRINNYPLTSGSYTEYPSIISNSKML